MVRIPQPSSRVLGWLVLVLVVVSLVMSMWTSYEQQQQAACQTDLNTRFLEALKNNQEVREADRDNLATTIHDVSQALNESDSRSETREILAQYEQRREQIDAEREDYPPLPDQVCE